MKLKPTKCLKQVNLVKGDYDSEKVYLFPISMSDRKIIDVVKSYHPDYLVVSISLHKYYDKN